MNKIKKRTLLMGLICILWLLVIFLFSAMNAKESSNLTEFVLDIVSYLRNKFFFIDELFLKLTQNHSIFYIVRKMAHMFVFCMLEIISFILLRTLGFSFFKSALYSILIVIGYACTDEFHQLFVSGRSGQLSDVFIDTIGGSIGLSIILLISMTSKIFKKIFYIYCKK